MEQKNENEQQFGHIGSSLLKTLIMLVGELDFSDIPFDQLPYFSHLTFAIFVFLFVMVLMNFLTGLAVSFVHTFHFLYTHSPFFRLAK